jgi:hypothetical protein
MVDPDLVFYAEETRVHLSGYAKSKNGCWSAENTPFTKFSYMT